MRLTRAPSAHHSTCYFPGTEELYVVWNGHHQAFELAERIRRAVFENAEPSTTLPAQCLTFRSVYSVGAAQSFAAINPLRAAERAPTVSAWRCSVCASAPIPI
jgi:hypothetical protein